MWMLLTWSLLIWVCYSSGHKIFEANLTSQCNQNCDCSPNHLEPICGINGITYFSPCHAGCTVAKDLTQPGQSRFLVSIPPPPDTPALSGFLRRFLLKTSAKTEGKVEYNSSFVKQTVSWRACEVLLCWQREHQDAGIRILLTVHCVSCIHCVHLVWQNQWLLHSLSVTLWVLHIHCVALIWRNSWLLHSLSVMLWVLHIHCVALIWRNYSGCYTACQLCYGYCIFIVFLWFVRTSGCYTACQSCYKYCMFTVFLSLDRTTAAARASWTRAASRWSSPRWPPAAPARVSASACCPSSSSWSSWPSAWLAPRCRCSWSPSGTAQSVWHGVCVLRKAHIPFTPSLRVNTRGSWLVLERRHTGTPTKTWVAYGNSHLACV